MIGIYKITNPDNKVYIGQSVDIERRWYEYHHKPSKTKQQQKLYNSFNKYGIDSHTFEVIVECTTDELNTLERYYQDMYDVMSESGLNLKLTTTADRSGYLSEETKRRVSESKKGQKYNLTDEQRSLRGKILSEALRNYWSSDKYKEQQILKQSEIAERKEKEKVEKLIKKEAKKLETQKRNEYIKSVTQQGTAVVDLETGFCFESLVKACDALNVHYRKRKPEEVKDMRRFINK